MRAHGADTAPIESGFDYHSYANVDQFRVTHLELELRVDLKDKSIDGTAALEVKRLDPRATQLVLDTQGLMITDVSQQATDVLGATAKNQTLWVSRPFHLEKPDPILGSALVIELPPTRKPTEAIRIDYETLPTSTALAWLTPKQTADRHAGFLYTRSAPIGARSWIPLQDTPAVRMTYKAKVHTEDSGVLALMSAESALTVKRKGEYLFAMPQPIPAYLIALAIGRLEFKQTGPRTGVYAEKSKLKAAAKEFADTESMMQSAEKMFGPYRFTRYDILVMPPSFPVNEIANPRLSFVSPTLIAGDKSPAPEIAHALARAWSGNLVGNASWRDVWLNEGLTAYLTTRIMTAVYGEARAAVEAVQGLQALREALKTRKPQDQVLAIDLRDRDPDLAISEVAYEKGRLFWSYLDAKFGRERFDVFLRGYWDHFALKSITTEDFLGYLDENLLDRFPGIVTRQQVDVWVHGPGIPDDAVLPVSSAFRVVDEARTAWQSGRLAAKNLGLDWVTPQWRYFFDNLPAALSPQQLAELDQAHGFTHAENAQIAQSWFMLVIANHYQPGFASLEDYLKSVGLPKLIVPLYTELVKSPTGTAFAKRVYAKARPGYSPDTVTAIDAIVTPDAAEGSDSEGFK
jgi:aminopeptidase N